MKARSWIAVAVAALSLGAAACMDLATSPPPTADTPRPHAARSDVQPPPQLLACPAAQDQQTFGIIGLLGGILSTGGTQIHIPLGAVLSPTLFEVEVPQSPYMKVEIHAVGLTTFLFHRPVNITIDYSRCGADAIPPGARLQGAYIDSQSNTILEMMSGTVDSAAHTITFPTSHLSGYGVAY